jgi:heat shock protein HtpX
MFWGGMRRRDNRDGGGLGGVLAILGLVLIILAPIVSQLIQFAISRKREFLADASGVLITRYPEGLARALEKISAGPPLYNINRATAHLYIANPFKSDTMKSVASLFSTHPPIAERIRRLRETT